MNLPLRSVLDLVPVAEGGTPAQALAQSAEFAAAVDQAGYHRLWLAEHHGMPGIASAATAVVLAHLGQHTRQIRLGSGGIMLPNHAPLAIAEQFGTLASLFPGRIDLGLGRAPGSDQPAARALRRGLGDSVDRFPEAIDELRRFFAPGGVVDGVAAIPGQGLEVPLYLLGSSLYGARLSAALGLPYAFASHFAPDALDEALAIYRREFQPSSQCLRPHAIVAANLFLAETDEEAEFLFTGLQQQFVNLLRGRPGRVPPPVESMAGRWSLAEETQARRMTRYALVGGPERVRRQLAAILAQTRADELMVTAMMFDPQARLRSFALFAPLFDELVANRKSSN